MIYIGKRRVSIGNHLQTPHTAIQTRIVAKETRLLLSFLDARQQRVIFYGFYNNTLSHIIKRFIEFISFLS